MPSRTSRARRITGLEKKWQAGGELQVIHPGSHHLGTPSLQAIGRETSPSRVIEQKHVALADDEAAALDLIGSLYVDRDRVLADHLSQSSCRLTCRPRVIG
jgi:hypothetical protein